MGELSKQERVKLMDINNRLHELEKRIFDVIVKTERNLRSPQNSSKVDDYNIILDVFYKYKDDGEKIAAFDRDYFYISKEILMRDDAVDILCTQDRNKFQHQDHTMKNEWRSRFYNYLYDECDLSFENILNIGKVDAILETEIYYIPKMLHIKPHNNIDDYRCIDYDCAEILKINSALQDIQKILINEAILYENELKQKLKDGTIKGFDMSYEVVFCSNEEDPKLNSIVAITSEPINMSKEMALPGFQNKWMRNYNIDTNDNEESHCYLFYSLLCLTNLRSYKQRLYDISEITLGIRINEYFETNV